MPMSLGCCELAKKGENQVGEVGRGSRTYCLGTYYIT